jgi:BolA protein
MMKYTSIERKPIIQARLEQALAPLKLEIIDESYKHIGHEGAKTGASHFAVSIVSAEFEGLSSIKRHQLIYDILGDLIPQDIHALKIQAKTPEEVTVK